MATAQQKKVLCERFEKLKRNWDFWTCFAWIQTRSFDVLEEVHAYRTSSALVRNAAHKVPAIIDRVCNFEHRCGRKSNCPLWQDIQRELSALCSDEQLIAYGVQSGADRPRKIPAEDWLLGESFDDPTSLDIGKVYWSHISFPAAIITTQFPPRGKPMSASRPSKVVLERYVESKINLKWPQDKIWIDAQTHFLPKSPTRQSVIEAYKKFIPNPRRGRPLSS